MLTEFDIARERIDTGKKLHKLVMDISSVIFKELKCDHEAADRMAVKILKKLGYPIK